MKDTTGSISGRYTSALSQPKICADISTYRHDERYDSSGFADALDKYDTAILEYWKQLGRNDGLSWPQNLGNNLKQVYFPHVKPVAAMRGLLNDK